MSAYFQDARRQNSHLVLLPTLGGGWVRDRLELREADMAADAKYECRFGVLPITALEPFKYEALLAGAVAAR